MSATGGNRIIRAVEIGGIRLTEFEGKTLIRSPREAAEVKMSLSTAASVVRPPAVSGQYRNFEIAVKMDLRLVAADRDQVLLSIRVVFELSYRLPVSEEFDEEEMKSFADRNAVFNAWPYFREVVQTTTARMGLPPVTLPLFKLGRPAEKKTV